MEGRQEVANNNRKEVHEGREEPAREEVILARLTAKADRYIIYNINSVNYAAVL